MVMLIVVHEMNTERHDELIDMSKRAWEDPRGIGNRVAGEADASCQAFQPRRGASVASRQ